MVKIESERDLLPLVITLNGITVFIYIHFKIKNANNLKKYHEKHKIIHYSGYSRFIVIMPIHCNAVHQ